MGKIARRETDALVLHALFIHGAGRRMQEMGVPPFGAARHGLRVRLEGCRVGLRGLLRREAEVCRRLQNPTLCPQVLALRRHRGLQRPLSAFTSIIMLSRCSPACSQICGFAQNVL